MHWDALPESPRRSQRTAAPRPIQLQPNCTQTCTCAHSQADIRARSQQTHALTLMQPGTRSCTQALQKQACLGNIQFYISCLVSFIPLSKLTPLSSLNKTSILSQASKFTQPKPCFTAPHTTFPRTLSLFFPPTPPHPSLPPLLAVAWQAGRADMFRMRSGNGLIKNAKQLAITARGPNGH